MHKCTWYQHTRDQKSVMDYFITRKQTKLRVLDVKVNIGAEWDLDHYMVIEKIYTPLVDKIHRDNNKKTQRKNRKN